MGEIFFIAFKLLFGLGIPAATVALNLASFGRTSRRGLNMRCAISALLLAIALLLGAGLFPMLNAANEYVRFAILALGATMATLSAVMALLGMYQIRRRPGRWSRGWKRAVWVFWLAVLYLCIYAGFFYIATHDELLLKLERFLQ